MAVLNLVQAVNQALREEMQRDDRVIILGEDVGKAGGVFRATEGLYTEFGPDRVIDTPLAESGIIGVSIGMALYGLKPVPEIQFLDFIYSGFDQIVSELAKYRYRSGGQWKAPVVIRAPCGGGVKGGHYHSQSSEAYFCHTAGLQVVMPSTPRDAKGLLKAAIRGDDPLLFLEPKKLYRDPRLREDVPDGDFTIPIGEARLARPGTDVSLITWGAMVPVALSAADQAKAEHIDVEVLDLRTLIPLDRDALLRTVEKTGRAIILHEAPRTAGFGAEVAALLAEKALLHLRAPILRVTGLDTPFPYTLEHLYLPDPPRVLHAIRQAMTY